MAFKGDLSTIGLADVFQMISMSEKEGTLVVQDAESRKCIFFGKDGIQLLSTGKRKGMRLGDLLVRAGKISEFRLQQVLEMKAEKKMLLGQALVEGGYVTQDDIDEVVRGQIEEEIYDLFLWKKAAFEFIEGPPPEELRDPDRPVIRLQMDVNSLLLEALRRVDEWKVINDKIHGMDAVLSLTSEQARQQAESTATEMAKKILRNIDGILTVGQLIERTGLPNFDVCRTLVDWLDAQILRLLSKDEIVEEADRKLRDGERDVGLRLYEASISQSPGDMGMVARYARALDGEGLSERAAAQYVRAGRIARDGGDKEAALQMLRRASELDEKDREVKISLFEVSLTSGKVEEVVKLGEELIRGAIASEEFELGRRLCQSMLDADPRQIRYRILLARILHRTGAREELEEQAEFIQKGLPVDPGASVRILKELSDFLPGLLDRRPKTLRKKRHGAGVGKLLLFVFVVLLLVLAFLVYQYHGNAQREYQIHYEKAYEFYDKGLYEEAVRELQSFGESSYRFDFMLKAKIEEDLRSLESSIRKRKEAKAAEVRENREKMRAEMERLDQEIGNEFLKGNLDRAKNLIDEMEKIAEALKNTEYLEKAKAHRGQISTYQTQAVDLDRKAKDLVKQWKCVEAAKLVDELRQRFRNHPVAKEARYPLALFVRPDGVSVRINNGAPEKIEGGRKLLHLDPGQKLEMSFSREGYVGKAATVNDPVTGEVVVRLDQKLERWVLADVAVSEVPLVAGGNLLVAGRNEVIAVGTEEPTVQWREKVEGEIIGRLRLMDGLILLQDDTNQVYCIDPSKPEGERRLWALPFSARLRIPPVISKDGDFVYGISEDKNLHAVDVRRKKAAWQSPFPMIVQHVPLRVKDLMLVCGADGALYALDLQKNGAQVWKYATDSGIAGTPLLAGDTAYLATKDGKVHAVSVGDGASRWPRPAALGAEATASPAAQGDVLFVSCQDGKLRAVSISGQEVKWSFEAGGPLNGRPAAEGDSVYFGSDDKNLYRLDAATGRLVWKFVAKDRVRTGAGVVGRVVFFGSDDGTLYAVDVE